MIRRFIVNLRHKPKPVRDKIALGIAGSVTMVVALAWLYHLPTKLASITEGRQGAATERSFSGLFGDVGEQIATVKESLAEDVVEETSPVAAEAAGSDIDGYDEYWPDKQSETDRVVRIITTTTTPSVVTPEN